MMLRRAHVTPDDIRRPSSRHDRGDFFPDGGKACSAHAFLPKSLPRAGIMPGMCDMTARDRPIGRQPVPDSAAAAVAWALAAITNATRTGWGAAGVLDACGTKRVPMKNGWEGSSMTRGSPS